MIDIIKNNADFQSEWVFQNPKLFGTLRTRSDGMTGTFEKVEDKHGQRVYWYDYTPFIVDVEDITELEDTKRYSFNFHIQMDKYLPFGFYIAANNCIKLEQEISEEYKQLEAFKDFITEDSQTIQIFEKIMNFTNQNSLSPLHQIIPTKSSQGNTKRLDEPGASIRIPRSDISDKKVSDAELAEIGRRGEVYLYGILLQQFSIVTWMNEFEESFMPYDFVVQDDNGNVLYIDCKSTNYNSPTFFITAPEWEFILNNTSQYAIYRVSNLINLPKVTIIKNPIDSLSIGLLLPYSYEKREIDPLIIPMCINEALISE